MITMFYSSTLVEEDIQENHTYNDILVNLRFVKFQEFHSTPIRRLFDMMVVNKSRSVTHQTYRYKVRKDRLV